MIPDRAKGMFFAQVQFLLMLSFFQFRDVESGRLIAFLALHRTSTH